MAMKNNVKLKLKTTTRMIIFGTSVFVVMLALGWLFYLNIGTPKTAVADEDTNGPYNGKEYVEEENAVVFEVPEYKLRSPQDPVIRGEKVSKMAVLLTNQN